MVKNDTPTTSSSAFNGIYFLSVLQTGILAPVFTRALDYDTPSDMNNTGAIPVINGTTNGTTQWVLTSQVVSVGVTPLTFAKFSGNPATYLLAANNLSDVSSKSTAFNNLSPMTTSGDTIYGGASGTGTRLGIGSTGNVYTVASGVPSWAPPAAAAAGTLTGTTLASNVVSSSLTTVGTIGTGTWQGSVIAPAYLALTRTINAQSGTTYTFALADGSAAGGNPLVTFGNAGATTVTVPAHSSIAFPVGTQIDCIQQGAGAVTFAAAGGVTLNSNGGLVIGAQYVGVSLINTATDTWTIIGFLT